MRALIAGIMMSMAVAACSVDPAGPAQGGEPVASIEVSPEEVNLAIGASVDLDVALRDVQGRLLTGRDVAFTSAEPRIVTVTSAGRAVAVAEGTTTITVRSEAVSKTLSVAILPVTPSVAEVRFPVESMALAPGQRLTVTAVALDAAGRPLPAAPVRYAAGGNGVVAVDSISGEVLALVPGATTITARSGAIVTELSVSVVATVPPLVEEWSVRAVDRGAVEAQLAAELLEFTEQMSRYRVTRFRSGLMRWNRTDETWSQEFVVSTYELTVYGGYSIAGPLVDRVILWHGTSREVGPGQAVEFRALGGEEVFLATPRGSGLETLQYVVAGIRSVILQFERD